FNRQIAQISKQEPVSKVKKIIDRYKAERRHRDYYETLGSLGLKVGIEFSVELVYDLKKDEVVGYLPSIKYHVDNPLNHTSGTFPLRCEDDYFKVATKAYA